MDPGNDVNPRLQLVDGWLELVGGEVAGRGAIPRRCVLGDEGLEPLVLGLHRVDLLEVPAVEVPELLPMRAGVRAWRLRLGLGLG